MNPWILTTKSLPPDETWVEILLPDGSTRKAQIVTNEFSETVWRTGAKDGKEVAHLCNYTVAQRKKFGILTKPNFRSPKAWRRL